MSWPGEDHDGGAARDIIPGQPQTSRQHDFALVVGVDHYQHVPSLSGAVNDARSVLAWLCAPDGGGVCPGHARFVFSTAGPPGPLQDEVDERLHELLKAANELGGGRRLYFYFAGHGAMSAGRSDDVALALAKWQHSLARSALSARKYRKKLAGLGLFKEVAIFLDCCRTVVDQAVGRSWTINFTPTSERLPETLTFRAYATGAGQRAHERPKDGQWQGVFTRCLLEILKRSPSGIRVGDLVNDLTDALEREVVEGAPPQVPVIKHNFLASSTFGPRREQPQLTIRLVEVEGDVRLLDGAGRLIATHPASPEPWQLALAPGRYELQDEAGRRVPIDQTPEGAMVTLDGRPAFPFRISVEESVRVNLYELYDSQVDLRHRGQGSVELTLSRGGYRVCLQRYGRTESSTVEHGAPTHLQLDSPSLETPALVAGPRDPIKYQAYDQSHAAPAQYFSREVTCAPLSPSAVRLLDEQGTPPATSRLFVFLRRAPGSAASEFLPGEPVTIHDVNGRLLAKITPATGHVDQHAGYLAFSCKVEPGTYRIRAVRSRRDVAITIPPYRAAQVFISDRGTVRLDDLRVSLVGDEQQFEPSNPISRAMEGVLFALSSPHDELPADARSLLPDAAYDDLCFGIAVAHLLLRSGDLTTFDQIMDRLRLFIADLPDLAILDRARGPQHRPPPIPVEAPPLLRASLLLATAAPGGDAGMAPNSAAAQATLTGLADSVWFTWSDRPWDASWVGPIIDDVRMQNADLGPPAIAEIVGLPVSVVEQTIRDLDATLPAGTRGNAHRKVVAVPGYVVGDVLGHGAQSTVFRARRERDQREIALKVVPAEGENQYKHVLRQIDLSPRLHHPALLALQDHGLLPDGTGFWLETELCRGSVLDRVYEADARLAMDEACGIVLQALDGLAYLHEQGVVHRDIKPSNLLIRTDGSIVIADFGLAKSWREGPSITGAGVPGGTVPYAAPEQLENFRDAKPPSDVWSMAATLYFLLTLELPRDHYAGQTDPKSERHNPVVPIAERWSGVPDALAQCIDRALENTVELRPPNGAAFRSELLAALGRTGA